MSQVNRFFPPELIHYLHTTGVQESPIRTEIREYTATLKHGHMSIAPEQGQLLGWLVGVLGVHTALEIGTYTGYSATVIAEALPADGQLICCEIDANHLATAKSFWQKAQLADKITGLLGPAFESVRGLREDNPNLQFDLIFIDADQAHYPQYFEQLLPLLSPRGVLLFDNAFWRGRVWDEHQQQASTQAIRQLNAHCFQDERLECCLLPIGDGLLLCRKR